MLITKYSELPPKMQNEATKKCCETLLAKKGTLLAKRIIDFTVCLLIFIVVSPIFLIICLLIKLTSKGPVFFKQERVGRDMKSFKILKFRTMVKDADKKGIALTTGNDSRITPFGAFLRKINMDEMPQLLNVIKGDMSIIGTRPEVWQYVNVYTDAMLATLLLYPGMVSIASIHYKNENDLLTGISDVEKTYIEKILPDKMRYNIDYLKNISVSGDFRILIKTIACAFEKD